MTDFLKLLLSLSLSGSVLAGIVWLCRRAAGRRLSCAAGYYLWLLVLLRLMLPFTIPDSVMANTFDRASAVAQQHWQQSDIPTVRDDAGASAASGDTAPPLPSADPAEVPSAVKTLRLPALSPAAVLCAVWSCGAAFVLLRGILSYWLLRRRLVRESSPPDPQDLAVFRQMYGKTPVKLICSAEAPTPMLLGLWRPLLVLPARSYVKNDMDAPLRFLLRHEMTHYAHRDLWYKWLVLAAQAVHWFNPLLPLLAKAIARDCELACDEAVTAPMDANQRRCYGNTLLAFAAASSLPRGALATTLAGSAKETLARRLKRIRSPYRRTAGTVLLTALLAAVLMGCGTALGSAVDPHSAKLPAASPSQPGSGDAQQAPPAALPENTAPPQDDDLVYLKDFIPGLYVDLKYATADNLTGAPLCDFTDPQLRYGTVKKLAAAQAALQQLGYSLKIWDAYHPIEVHQALWDACPDPAYVSDPATGYLGHTRGNTVDVTLVLADGTEIAMPSGFDQFDARADRDYSDVSPEAAAHATLLQTVMEAAGFEGYRAEWSHYSDTDEYAKIGA